MGKPCVGDVRAVAKFQNLELGQIHLGKLRQTSICNWCSLYGVPTRKIQYSQLRKMRECRDVAVVKPSCSNRLFGRRQSRDIARGFDYRRPTTATAQK